MPVILSPDEARALNARFEGVGPDAVLAWAAEALHAAPGCHVVVPDAERASVHLISQVCPHVPILFLDTGYHFPGDAGLPR